MGSPDSAAKTSPWVLMTLLGGLSLAFIFLIRRGDELPLPLVLVSKRQLQNEDEFQRFRNDIQSAFQGIAAWEQLCEDPSGVLSSLSLGGQRRLESSSSAWEAARPHLPSSERDASFRCRSAQFQADDLRSKFCFHLASDAPGEAPELSLLELNLEWYETGQRRPLSCTEALMKGSELELAVYYSYYRAIDRSGDEWAFARLAGGVRLAPLRFKGSSSADGG